MPVTLPDPGPRFGGPSPLERQMEQERINRVPLLRAYNQMVQARAAAGPSSTEIANQIARSLVPNQQEPQ
jgi:hypothetical protein